MAKHTLLFVDDEPSILSSLLFTFQREYNVLTATSGSAAMDYFKSHSIEVVVSDQRMPEMLGVDLLKRVKEMSPTTMRLLLTGYSDLEAIMRSVNAGEVFRYINKPWNTERLKATIAFACQISAQMRQAQAAHQTLPTQVPVSKPVTATNSQNSHQPQPAMPQLLCVGTNSIQLSALKTLLSSEYIVHTASSADEAFSVLRKSPISAIMTEDKVGSSNGVDFLVAMSEEFPDIISILFGDSEDASTAIRLINEGRVFKYLVKPFRREVLWDVLRQAVERHRLYLEKPSMNVKRQEKVLLAPFEERTKRDTFQDALTRARARLLNRDTY